MRRVRNRHSVVTARGCCNAGAWDIPAQKVGERTSRLKRARVLKQLELQNQPSDRQTEVSGNYFHDGRPANPRTDQFFSRGDRIRGYVCAEHLDLVYLGSCLIV